jgi:hypothetical protein
MRGENLESVGAQVEELESLEANGVPVEKIVQDVGEFFEKNQERTQLMPRFMWKSALRFLAVIGALAAPEMALAQSEGGIERLLDKLPEIQVGSEATAGSRAHTANVNVGRASLGIKLNTEPHVVFVPDTSPTGNPGEMKEHSSGRTKFLGAELDANVKVAEVKGGITVNQVNALNVGREGGTYWFAGAEAEKGLPGGVTAHVNFGKYIDFQKEYGPKNKGPGYGANVGLEYELGEKLGFRPGTAATVELGVDSNGSKSLVVGVTFRPFHHHEE